VATEGRTPPGILINARGPLALAVVADARLPLVSPWILQVFRPLGRILPFLFGRQSLARPLGIRTGIVQIDIDDGVVLFACGRLAVNPMLQEILSMARLVAGRAKELGILLVRHGSDIDGIGG
jgi:hypothetical protein